MPQTHRRHVVAWLFICRCTKPTQIDTTSIRLKSPSILRLQVLKGRFNRTLLISDMNNFRDTYMKTRKAIQPTWLHGFLCSIFGGRFSPSLFFRLYSRVQGKFFVGLLTASGIAGDYPSMRDILFLYRQDLLIFGVLAPLLTAASFVVLRFAHAALLTIFVVLATQVLLYVNLQSWGQVGSFLTWQALLNAIAFGLSNPEFIGEYLSLRGVLRLLALLLISTAILVVGRRFWHWHRLIQTGALLGSIGVVTSALLALAGFSSGMHTAPISGSFVVNAIRALENTDVSPQRQTAVELDRQYRQLSQLSLPVVQGPNFAIHRGSNLLMFILETGSIEFLDVRHGLPEHPVFEQTAWQDLRCNKPFRHLSGICRIQSFNPYRAIPTENYLRDMPD